MQIHELNTFSGDLDNANLILDDGTDTGKKLIPAVLAEVNNDISDLSDRVDNIIAEPTVNAELIDIRSAANGYVYSAAGESVRRQVGYADLFDLFEIGNVAISNSGWNYDDAPNTKRIRTKQGITFPLKAGDVIGLSDYTSAQFYVGWYSGGTYGSYAAWRSSDYTATVDGDYIISLRYNPEVQLTTVTDLVSLLKGVNISSAFWLNKHENYIANNSKITPLEHPGYFGGSGELLADTTAAKPVITEPVPAKYGDTLKLDLYLQTVDNMWAAYCAYDASGAFLERVVLRNTGYNFSEYHKAFTITNMACAFVRITYRTFGDHKAVISFPNIAEALKEKQNDISEIISKASVNEHIRSVNHRGYSLTAPENTLPAFRLSKKMGFDWVETDIRFTADDVPVLLHDSSINRTAKNMDGTTISGTKYIADLTYAQAASYDYGLWRGQAYAGTTIPNLDEFLALIRAIGLHAYIEIMEGETEAHIRTVLDKIHNYSLEDQVAIISGDVIPLRTVVALNDSIQIVAVFVGVNAERIGWTQDLMTGKNKVSLSSYSFTSDEVNLCKAANIPMEVWYPITRAQLLSLDPYISAVTHDQYIAGYELYKANID